MTTTKITYEQLFPLAQYSNVRLGMEITITQDDNIQEAFDKAKNIIESNFNRLFPQVEQAMTDFHTGQQMPMPGKEGADKEFNDFKAAIDTYTSAQSAWDHLSASPFKYSIEAKKYVTEKFTV